MFKIEQKKKKIQDLIFSQLDSKEIAEKLIEKLLARPYLYKKPFESGRYIFHYLVLEKKFHILKEVLAHESLRSFASKVDGNGQTILHYMAMKDRDCEAEITLITTHLPEILNLQDINGETALHLAVENQRIGTVCLLVKNNQLNRLIRNKRGQMPLDLAGKSEELQKALMFVEPSQLARSLSSNTVFFSGKISETFPSFSSRKLKEVSSSEMITKPELRVTTDSKIIKLHLNLFNVYQSEGVSDEFFNVLQEGLYLSYQKNDLTSELKELFFSYPEIRTFTHSVLSPFVGTKYLQFNLNKKVLLENLNYLLIRYGVLGTQSPIEKPNFKEIDPDLEEDFIEIIWMITAGYNSKIHRQFDFELLTHSSVGLLNLYGFEKIINCFTVLYPYLDDFQKLVANFITFQLLDNMTQADLDRDFVPEIVLDTFLRWNISPDHGLSQGQEINQIFFSLITVNNNFYEQPLLKNYRILTQCLCDPSLDSQNASFDSLVNNALDKTSGKRDVEVELIANEIRTLSVSFYQNVTLHEFNFIVDSQSAKIAPHIVLIRNYFNRLNNYFLKKILLQPEKNVTNVLKFLLELAQALCPLYEENYPDLNHLMVISGVLNNSSIMRLKNHLAELSENEKEIIHELETMVSFKNFKWMREIQRTHRSTLPFLGMFTKDLTFAQENQNQLDRIQVNGDILLKIKEVKDMVHIKLSRHETDLPILLQRYKELNEHVLYRLSLRIKPNKEVFDLSHTTRKPLLALTNLNDNFLKNNVIPSLKYREQLYLPTQLAPRLLIWFKGQVDSLIDHMFYCEISENHTKKRSKDNLLCNPPIFGQTFLKIKQIEKQANQLKKSIYRKSTYALDLTQLERDPLTLLDDLYCNYLLKGVIPPIRFNETIYLPINVVTQLNVWLRRHLRFLDPRSKDKRDALAKSFLTLSSTLHFLLEENHNSFFPDFELEKLNPVYLMNGINEIKALLKQLKPTLEKGPSRIQTQSAFFKTESPDSNPHTPIPYSYSG